MTLDTALAITHGLAVVYLIGWCGFQIFLYTYCCGIAWRELQEEHNRPDIKFTITDRVVVVYKYNIDHFFHPTLTAVLAAGLLLGA
jgi:hypothetical protein